MLLATGNFMSLRRLIAFTTACWLVAAVVPAQSSSATLVALQDGSNIEHAIPIDAQNERTGVAEEYRWIGEHFPGYKRAGQALLNNNGRAYDVIDITTVSGERRKLYFDITAFFGKM
jgi:hypothetical protein